MAICDKISTVGNKLQNNLNARGVSCTYGKTVQSKQDLEAMADLIVSSNLKGSADYLLSLTASRPYLLENETTDLIARLTNGLGVPQANKEITIYDNQGGALLLPDNWTVTNGSVSVSGKNITLTATSATNLFIVDPGLSFEDYNVTFTLQPGVSLYWSVTNGTPSNKLNASVGGRVISLEKKGSTLYRKVDSTQLGAIEEHNGLIAFELSDSGSATVQCSNDASLYRGITNNNGTYTKMGVSVSTVTNFTATYNTVNSSECTVYPCIYRDYATSDNKSDYYITGAGGTTLTWSNEYYVLGLGSSSNYVDLKSITDNVKGKTVNFKVDVVLNGASIRLRVFNGGTPLASSAYTTSDGTVKVENVAIPSDATSILFRIERRYLTDGDSIKFKNFRIYSI